MDLLVGIARQQGTTVVVVTPSHGCRVRRPVIVVRDGKVTSVPAEVALS